MKVELKKYCCLVFAASSIPLNGAKQQMSHFFWDTCRETDTGCPKEENPSETWQLGDAFVQTV